MALTYPPSSGYRYIQGNGSSAAIDRITVFPKLPVNFADYYTAFTLEFYLYLHSLTENGGVFSTLDKGDEWNSDRGFIFYVRDSGGQGYHLSIGDTYDRVGTPPVEAWFHVGITYDGSNLVLYEDGSLIMAVAESNVPSTGNMLGSFCGIDTIADIEVANLRLWDHARSQAQLQEGMTTDYPESEPGLMAGFRLDGTGLVESAAAGVGTAFLLNNPDSATATWGIEQAVPPLETRLFYPIGVLGDMEEEPEVLPGQISGTVTVKGDPAAQRVMAFNRANGMKVAETTSDSNGAYTLTGLDPSAAHYVVALDKNLEYNGVIADNITPEVPA